MKSEQPGANQNQSQKPRHPDPPLSPCADDPVVTIGLEEVVRQLTPRALRLARRFPLDGACPEDVVQEAFIAFYRHQPAYADADDAWRWLSVVVRRQALYRGRRLRRLAPGVPVPDAASEPCDRVSWADAFTELSSADRETIKLALAGTEGWPVIMRKRLQRARDRLAAASSGLSALLLRVRDRADRVVPALDSVGIAAVAAVLAVSGAAPASAVPPAPATPGAAAALSDPPPSLHAPARAPMTPDEGRAAPPDRPATSSMRPARPSPLVIPTPAGDADAGTGTGGQGKAVCVKNAHIDICTHWPDVRPLIPRP